MSSTWEPSRAPSATAVKLMPAAAHTRPFVVRAASRTAYHCETLLSDLLNRGLELGKRYGGASRSLSRSHLHLVLEIVMSAHYSWLTAFRYWWVLGIQAMPGWTSSSLALCWNALELREEDRSRPGRGADEDRPARTPGK